VCLSRAPLLLFLGLLPHDPHNAAQTEPSRRTPLYRLYLYIFYLYSPGPFRRLAKYEASDPDLQYPMKQEKTIIIMFYATDILLDLIKMRENNTFRCVLYHTARSTPFFYLSISHWHFRPPSIFENGMVDRQNRGAA
jgi:hypothetical protein